MEKIVLTGGPGSGKSSIILALEMMGEYVVREAAEDYIRMKQAMGIKEPWTEEDFQMGILELQLSREEKIPKEAERVWLDRGTIDGLAYAKEGTETYAAINLEANKSRYDKVFIIEPLESCETNGIRRENLEGAKELGRKLEECYRKLGYEIIRIPTGTVEERVNKILEEL